MKCVQRCQSRKGGLTEREKGVYGEGRQKLMEKGKGKQVTEATNQSVAGQYNK